MIHNELSTLMSKWGVKLICTETMSWPRNAGVVAKMGIVWGVIASVANVYTTPITQASPMEIKRVVAGDGKASKERMIESIKRWYPSMVWPAQETLHEHVADSLGAIMACQNSEIFKWARSQ